MLFASGVNFGMWRTMPHALGISFGFGVLLAAVGGGVGVILATVPLLLIVIKVAGGLYMVFLAWKITNSDPVEVQEGAAQPMTFLQAALFQWVNPKAWVMATVAMSTYTAEGPYALNVAIVIFAFVVLNFPSVTVWAGFGTVMRNFLKDSLKLKIFNYVMATALVLSLWPMLAT